MKGRLGTVSDIRAAPTARKARIEADAFAYSASLSALEHLADTSEALVQVLGALDRRIHPEVARSLSNVAGRYAAFSTGLCGLVSQLGDAMEACDLREANR